MNLDWTKFSKIPIDDLSTILVNNRPLSVLYDVHQLIRLNTLKFPFHKSLSIMNSYLERVTIALNFFSASSKKMNSFFSLKAFFV